MHTRGIEEGFFFFFQLDFDVFFFHPCGRHFASIPPLLGRMGPIIKQKVIIRKTKKKLFYYLSAAENTYGYSEPRFNQWVLIEKPSHPDRCLPSIPPIGDLPRTAVAGFALAWQGALIVY